MKTSKLSNSLKYLSQAYLGWDLIINTIFVFCYILLFTYVCCCKHIFCFCYICCFMNKDCIYKHNLYFKKRKIIHSWVCLWCRYDIQNGVQYPYEDSVAAMRLYLKMRSQPHPRDYFFGSGEARNSNNFPAWKQRELERMSPEALLQLSGSDYYCWCLDSYK